MGLGTTLRVWFTPPSQGNVTVRCSNALQPFSQEETTTDSQTGIDQDAYELDSLVDGHEAAGGAHIERMSPFDVFLAHAVKLTGSLAMFAFMWATLMVWFVWGVLTGYPNHWQIVMQDGQSIQTYVWDTLLMRQQLDDTDGFLRMYGQLKSRGQTVRALLKRMGRLEGMGGNQDNNSLSLVHTTVPLSWFDHLSNIMSALLGSLPAIVLFWLGIAAWLWWGSVPLDDGEGNMLRWSDRWQMVINTIVAVELLVTSVFLENIRARNNDAVREDLRIFAEVDAELERECRLAMNETKDNPVVTVEPCPKPGLKKAISAYSDIIGTGIGLVISAAVFAAWISTGPLMDWNDNWWLIIGTYTGLVSFTESFVLRCVYFDITAHEEAKFRELLADAQEMLDITGIDMELVLPKQRQGPMDRISMAINATCSTQWAVLVSLAMVLALLSIATALHWSTTGQLIANTPTMIIEGFFHLILIQAHNWAHETRAGIVAELNRSRAVLLAHLRPVSTH